MHLSDKNNFKYQNFLKMEGSSEVDIESQNSRSKCCPRTLKFIRYLAIFVSFVLCVWQVSFCIKRYVEEPLGLRVTQEPFWDFMFPAITICPASTNYTFDVEWKFQEKCEKDETCKKLDRNERMNYPFHKLNTTFLDMWDVWGDSTTAEWGSPDCKYALDERRCLEEKWLFVNKVDTVAGSCVIFYRDLQWIVYGKILALWIRIHHTHFIPKDPNIGRYMIRFSPINSTQKEFVPRLYLEDGAINEIEISFTEHHFLNTSRNPCVTPEEENECYDDCSVSQFIDEKPGCKWPVFMDADLPYCDTMSEVKGAGEVIFELSRQNVCECDVKCVHFDYGLTHVIRKTDHVNTTEIKIFVPSNSKQIVTEFLRFPFSALVSELGGSIGLFLGVSIISTITYFESLWCWLLKAIKKIT